MDYFLEDFLIDILLEFVFSLLIVIFKFVNYFCRNVDFDFLFLLFFSLYGKGIGERFNMIVGDVIVEVCILFRRMLLRLKR